jgi:pimeloyl-ACP methyl ester carboxylesterase
MAPALIKIALTLFAVFLFLRWFERRQVYQPSNDILTLDPVPGHPPEDVSLTTSDGVSVHGWFFPAEPGSPRAGQVICLFHGNAGNLSHRGETFRALLGLGVNVLAIDYRGFGRSGGSPSEEGTYRDAEAAYDWLIRRGFAPASIIAQGESLGGGIASHLAASRPVGGLILQSTYTSIEDLGRDLFPFLPVRLVGKIKYPTRSRVGGLKVPVMVMHSRIDEVIPYHHGQANFAAASEPKLFWELKAGHNDYLMNDGPNYIAGLRAFLDRFFPGSKP